MAAKGREIYRVLSRIGPFVFCLEVPSYIAAVDLKSDVVVNITCIEDMVNGDRDFGGNNVFGCLYGLCA